MSFFGLIPTCLMTCGAILKNITIKLIQLWFGRSRKEHFWKIGDPFYYNIWSHCFAGKHYRRFKVRRVERRRCLLFPSRLALNYWKTLLTIGPLLNKTTRPFDRNCFWVNQFQKVLAITYVAIKADQVVHFISNGCQSVGPDYFILGCLGIRLDIGHLHIHSFFTFNTTIKNYFRSTNWLVVISVTRLGDNLPLWRNFKIFAELLKTLFTIWQNFEPSLANM